MKRNKLLTLALAACATLLAACSTEIETSGNPDRAGAGEAIVAVSLQFPQADQPAGYADQPAGYANVPAGVSLDAEKEIKSIAFIAFTQGGTGVYLSTNPTLDDRGLTRPLTPVEGQPIGNYTAQFKIKSADLSGKTTLVAIANFKEHGLNFDNTEDLTIASLRAMLTEALEADGAIEYPLLMTLAQEQELVEGSSVTVPFEMERIVARVDVLNSAYDKANPQNRFVLTSARLLSAPAQGTMIGGELIAAPTYVDLEVQDEVNEVAPAEGDLTTPVKQQLAPMYVYENSNTDPGDATKLAATATSVELKGTYKGKEYHKIIPFVTAKKVVEGALTGNEIIPIVRNYRYVVEILSSDENTLDFALKTTDWVDGKELDVKVDMEAPKIEAKTPPGGAYWRPASQTLDVTDTYGETEFSIMVSGVRDTDFAVEADYDENPVKLVDGIKVQRGELSGYADAETGSLRRVYTVKTPKVTGEYPINVKLLLFNEKAKTVINIKYSPLFVADLKSDRTEAIIDPAAQLIDLRRVPLGTTGTFSFFATSLYNPITTVSNNQTADFFSVTTTEDEADPAILAKYGPGKRVTVSYKALTDNPELATATVKDVNGIGTPKNVYVKCLKKPYYQGSVNTDQLNPANTLSEHAGGKLTIYLAINNADHGKIRYDVVDNADYSFTPNFVATYNTDLTSPNWATQGLTATMTGAQDYMGEYNCVRGYIEVTLPTTIKNPAQAKFAVGIPDETPVTLIPVYPSGSTITEADKQFQPVLVKGVWWAPINVGQTKISEVGDPSSKGGHRFQWGRKLALAFDSSTRVGPVVSAEAAGSDFILNPVSPYDWLATPAPALWNSGTEANPIKTANDPCPEGWRVPTATEGGKLGSVTMTKETAPSAGLNANNINLFAGDLPNTKLIYQATGRLSPITVNTIHNPGVAGYCWMSRLEGDNAATYYFENTSLSMKYLAHSRGYGLSVRCVQE